MSEAILASMCGWALYSCVTSHLCNTAWDHSLMTNNFPHSAAKDKSSLWWPVLDPVHHVCVKTPLATYLLWAWTEAKDCHKSVLLCFLIGKNALTTETAVLSLNEWTSKRCSRPTRSWCLCGRKALLLIQGIYRPLLSPHQCGKAVFISTCIVNPGDLFSAIVTCRLIPLDKCHHRMMVHQAAHHNINLLCLSLAQVSFNMYMYQAPVWYVIQ